MAAFFTAVVRRFGQGTTTDDVVQFVADIRSQMTEAGSMGIDPRVAERLVLTALGRSDLDGSDDKMVVRVETALLLALISAEHLDRQGLDRFLEDALILANEWAE